MDERREFLKRVAKGAVYVSPVIYTLSSPRDLMANVRRLLGEVEVEVEDDER